MRIHTLDLNFLNSKQVLSSYLVESDPPFLVETGPDSTFENLKAELRKFGYEIKDIKYVFITHIHLDHSGAAFRFANEGAKIYVHPNGKRHLVNPEKLIRSATMVYKERTYELWGDTLPIDEEKVIETSDGQIITIGDIQVRVLDSPGHAKHHNVYLIDDHLFTGDTGGVRIGNGPIMPAVPPPDIDIPIWLKTIEKMKSYNATYICPSHFGCFSDVEYHLETLRKNLIKYDEFIKKQIKFSDDYNTLFPIFKEYVDSFFTDKKVRDFYQFANPDEMNLAGLIRYAKVNKFDVE
ncbi:Glyoxylase, beta-lactamase superfamily II [Thermodesulfobium acidiphilum]|uniref:Glyoxylase, beta-lactamase superfamily II n=1 Tax=Thermodesulfobium acidiphilum TaxID=1794699 RepID=A0A2R4W1V0_THEAF|nr:MBL fold metallo-hydrolase [Thermodesulfobium acidiphilum]AWB10773.1 Glyoxylase, beta-lactamase superfamily II [Thermodesulfobium acidiphilum]